MATKSATPKIANKPLGVLVLLFFALLPLVFSRSLYDGSFLLRYMYLNFAGLALLGLATAFHPKFRKDKWSLSWPLLAYLVFWLAHLIAAPQAINGVEAEFGILKVGSVLVWLLVLHQLLLSGLIALRDVLRGLVIFAGISIAWSGVQILQTLASGDFWTNIYAVHQPFEHKNLLSGALMLFLPFLMMAAAGKDKGWGTAAKILLVVALVEIFVLRTRAAWFATLAGMGAVGLGLMLHKIKHPLLNLKNTIIAGVAGIALMLMLVAIPSSGEKITDAGNLKNRFWFWENSWQMLQEHPLGVGPGNWRSYLPKYGLDRADNRVQNGITTINRPHNDYLWVATELGWLGLAAFLAVFVMALVQLHQIITTQKEDFTTAMGLLFGLVSYLVFSITDFPLERADHQILLAALLAVLSATRLQKSGKGAVGIPALAGILFGLGLWLWAAAFMQTRFDSGKANMQVLQANERKDARRIVPAVDAALSSAFNVDFYGNPLYYFRGLGNNALQQFPQAEQDFLKALELHPHHIISMNQLGNVYKNQNRLDEALVWYDKALAIAPQFVQAQLNVAEVYIKQQKWNDAFMRLRTASTYDNNPKLQLLLKDFLPRFAADAAMQAQYPEKVAAITKLGAQPEQMVAAFMQLRGTGPITK